MTQSLENVSASYSTGSVTEYNKTYPLQIPHPPISNPNKQFFKGVKRSGIQMFSELSSEMHGSQQHKSRIFDLTTNMHILEQKRKHFERPFDRDGVTYQQEERCWQILAPR